MTSVWKTRELFSNGRKRLNDTETLPNKPSKRRLQILIKKRSSLTQKKSLLTSEKERLLSQSQKRRKRRRNIKA